MADLPPWATVLIAVASIAGACLILWRIILLLAPGLYRSMIKHNQGDFSVDDFVGGPPSPISAFKSWFLGRLQCGSRTPKVDGYPLKTDDSDKVPGLKVTSRDDAGTNTTGNANPSKPPVVVGTIRMGFGHHRIAYAATSWGLDDSGSSGDRETW